MTVSRTNAVTRNFPAASLLWLFSCVARSCLVAAGADPASMGQPADQFKKFIEHPPLIADLFFERQYFDGKLTPYPPSYCRIKWQPNATFVAFEKGTNVAAMYDATNWTDFFASDASFENIYWHQVDNTYYAWTNRNLPEERTNSINLSVNLITADTLFAVMNMGLDMMPPGCLHWAGDSFSLTNKAGDRWYRGALSRDEAGRASEITVISSQIGHAPANNDGLTTCDYFYDAPLALSFLPSRIAVTKVVHGAQTSQTIKIHSLTLGLQPLGMAAFSPVALAGKPVDLITISNGYLVSSAKPAPGIVPLNMPDSMIRHLREPTLQRWYFTMALLLLSIPFLIFLFSQKRRGQNDQSNQ